VSKGDEWNEYRTPVSCKPSTQYKPWVETVAFDHFTPISLDLRPDAQGHLRLSRKFHDKYVLRKPDPLPKEPRAEHRDLSWYVDTTVDSPPIGSPDGGTPSGATTFVHAPVGRQTRQAARKARSAAAVNHLHGTTEDHASAAVDDTLFAVARWIQTRMASDTNVTRME